MDSDAIGAGTPAIYGVLGAGTSAIEVGNRIWVGSTKSDRVGIFDLRK